MAASNLCPFFLLVSCPLHALTSFYHPFEHKMWYGTFSSLFQSCNEAQMDTLISNQRGSSGRQEVMVWVHLPVCLPSVVPLFNLPVDELTGG